MTANDLVIKCSSLRWVCLDVRKGPLVFMIPEGGPTLLKAVCAVCLDLNVATAFRSNTCRTYIWEPAPPKAATGNVCCRPYIDKHMGGGRRLMQKLARCQLHFCGFSYSLSLCGVCVRARWHTGWIFNRTWLKSFDLTLTYVWSFCKHVSTGKHSTCMNDTHADTHACCSCMQFIYFSLVRLEIKSTFILLLHICI